MTPDPSALPIAVWITGYAGSFETAWLSTFALLALGLSVIALLLATVTLTTGLRR